MFCHHCGKEIDEKANFCIFCGKKIGGSQSVIPEHMEVLDSGQPVETGATSKNVSQFKATPHK